MEALPDTKHDFGNNVQSPRNNNALDFGHPTISDKLRVKRQNEMSNYLSQGVINRANGEGCINYTQSFDNNVFKQSNTQRSIDIDTKNEQSAAQEYSKTPLDVKFQKLIHMDNIPNDRIVKRKKKRLKRAQNYSWINNNVKMPVIKGSQGKLENLFDRYNNPNSYK